jgi:hypothetical protein
MRKLLAPILGAVCLIGAFGCAGDSTIFGDDHNPRVRFANAVSAGVPLNAFIDDEQIGTSVNFGQTSNEGIFTNGNHTATIRNANTGAVFTSTEATFELNSNYTLVAYSAEGAGPRLFSYRDNEDTTVGKGEIRVIRATDAFGDVDVYIFPVGGSMSAAPTFSLDALAESTDVLALDPGQYTIRIFRSGETTGAFINETVTVTSERNVSYLFARTPTGTDALLSFQDN